MSLLPLLFAATATVATSTPSSGIRNPEGVSFSPVEREAHELRVGLLIGEPMSVTASWTINPRWALHLDVGPSISKRYEGVLALDLAYAFPEFFSAKRSGDRFMPWLGLGLRGALGKDEFTDRLGARVPFGISFISADDSIELFVSIAPGVSFAPDIIAALDGGLGARFGW